MNFIHTMYLKITLLKAQKEYQTIFHSPEKISAVGAFLEANHHSIITHRITLDKKTLQ